MLLRSIFAILSVCSVFMLWAIAVSADDAKQAKFGSEHLLRLNSAPIDPGV
ncbi:hypothetical protein [Hyphomicrobium sp. MC8b]|jgi:hypothetical protein|uniref:hypothetical protein n=1 Tax=unclassified Hyphomicrobium TaxID=2619925 RepID=UPI00391AA254